MNGVEMPLDEETAWQALVDRDEQFAGAFVVAVTSTKIYCRPSCPSRRPLRKNVRFFATPAEARAAGFRACLRCKPDSSEPSSSAQLVQRARSYLEARVDEPVTLDELGRHAGASPHHLQRTFKRLLGVTPKQYVAALRADRFKSGLRNGRSVTTAIYDAGYGSSSRAYENARLGMTPTAYRDGGRGMTVRYTVVPSSLGRVLVGATERGICSVMLGGSEASLAAELRRDFPKATVSRAEDGLGGLASAVAQLADGAAPAAALPLDVRGSAFQGRVWRALRRISAGSTKSYREIAVSLGKPKAARAVGRACATNPVSLVIPCHRAVREDGGLGGYRWGLDLKERLLEREKRAAKTGA
jgi:AraC family transcriptional regulator of adaptative response/methylated-DNA-[protein]-cysteine methyltransferase